MLDLIAAIALAGVDPAVDAHLKLELLDYDSAKVEPIKPPFESVLTQKASIFSKKPDTTTTVMVHCYRVNAKNRFGGYTGWKISMFHVVDGKVTYSRQSPEGRYTIYEVEKACAPQ